jgi:hypothetical protein
MVLERATLNNNHVIFQSDATGKKTFFPKLTTLSADDGLRYFEELMNLLADSFELLPSDRYLTIEEAPDGAKENLVLTPKTFKKWLFHLSLTRAGHNVFEEIKAMFANKPYFCGEIGFSKERGEIEIMVEDKATNTRLPISRLGSGHQQILYIIAKLILNKGRMLAIEEDQSFSRCPKVCV